MFLIGKIKIYVQLKNILLHLESSYLVIETNVPIRGNVYKCLKNYLF